MPTLFRIDDSFTVLFPLLTNDIDYNIKLLGMYYQLYEYDSMNYSMFFHKVFPSVKKKIIKHMFIDFLQRDGLTSVFNSKHQGGPRLSRVKKTWDYISTLYNYPNILVLTHM